MITPQQREFVQYWEQNREMLGTTSSKLLRGLPMALLFGLPILLLIAVVYLFLPDWFYTISKTKASTYAVIVLAVFIAVAFFSYVRMHFKWEMNEQLYKELKYKINKETETKNEA
jgi:membrane protein YdbS with pleckstrin-like domain